MQWLVLMHIVVRESGSDLGTARLSGSTTCWTGERVSAFRLLPRRPGHETTYRYDLAGRLIERTEPSGQVTRYAHDALGRCTRVDYADGEWAEMTYDAAGNVVSTTASDGTVLTQAFDAAGRLESQTNGALQRRLSYSYTPAGLRSSMTVTNLGDGTQRTTGYAWGPDGLLSGVTPWTGDPITLTYNAGRRRTAVAFATGASIDYSYDPFGRPAAIESRDVGGQVTSFVRYTRDALGNPVTMTDTGGQTRYAYDLGLRLIEAVHPDGTLERFTHDPVGNRLTVENGDGLTTCSFDAANRLVAESGARNVDYAWDADGNLVTKTMNGDVTRYDWSARNKLTHVLLPNGSTRDYAYYPESDLRRLARDGSGAETSFLWDGRNVLEELDGLGATTGAFINGVDLDDRFAYVTASAACPVVADAVGSIRGVLDPAGTPLNRYAYTAYGLPRATDETLPFAYRFGGQPWDDETELAYVRARYLDPRSGRFISSDPLRERDRYAYAGGNPAYLKDPTGLSVDEPAMKGTMFSLAKEATSKILLRFAPWLYATMDDADYEIALTVSYASYFDLEGLKAHPELTHEKFSREGSTGWDPTGKAQQDSFNLYKTNAGSGGSWTKGCALPPEPLYAVAFFGTLAKMRDNAKALHGLPSFAWIEPIRDYSWAGLVLFHEALHALNFSDQSIDMDQRADAAERAFYWILVDQDQRWGETVVFKTEEVYDLVKDSRYGPIK